MQPPHPKKKKKEKPLKEQLDKKNVKMYNEWMQFPNILA